MQRNQVIEMSHDLAIAAAALVYVASDEVQWGQFMTTGAEASQAQQVPFRPGLLTREGATHAAGHLLMLAEAALRQLEPDVAG